MNRSLVPNPESSLGAKAKALTGNSQEIGKLYTTNPNNWYKALPYSFMFTDRNGNSSNFFVLNVPYFQELGTSTIFDGYTGIQSTNEMDVCCPNHSY
jgi:hypothetical protein